MTTGRKRESWSLAQSLRRRRRRYEDVSAGSGLLRSASSGRAKRHVQGEEERLAREMLSFLFQVAQLAGFSISVKSVLLARARVHV